MGIFGWDGDHNFPKPAKPAKSPKPPKSSGGGKKGGGGLCVQVAPFAAWPALISLAGAIAASFIG